MTIWSQVREHAAASDAPHAVMSERAVLAAWLELGDRPAGARSLVVDDFCLAWHRELFGYLDHLAGHDQPCDVLAVHQHMRNKGVTDGDKYLDLVELIEWRPVTSSGDPTWFMHNILDAATTREEIKLGQRLTQRPADADLAHAEHDSRVASIARRANPADADLFSRHVHEAVTRYTMGLAPAIPTGLPDLDLLIDGLRPGGVTVIASRPGVGKSLLVTTIAANICDKGLARVGFISLEMSAEEVQDRLIGGAAGIPTKTLRRAGDALTQGDWLAIDAARERIDDWPLDIAARAHDQHDLRAYAERVAAQSPRGVLIVDYLQRVREAPGVQSRERHVSQVSNTLKDIAVDLDLAVVAVASMSRETERRGGRPRMSDLRDSGTIESDADVVLLLWQSDTDMDSNLVDGIVDKNRHGRLGETQFVRRGEVGRMDNLSRVDGVW